MIWILASLNLAGIGLSGFANLVETLALLYLVDGRNGANDGPDNFS